MHEILDRLAATFDPEVVRRALVGFLPDLAVAALTFFVFVLAWRIARRVATSLMTRAHVDRTAQTFVLAVLQYAVLLLGAITALGALGVDMTSVLASLGVAGLTIGFAARDALSNVISGIFIFWDRPFVIGDLVEVGGFYGRVEHITMRSTRLVTPDGKMLAIPNSTIVNSTVASYTNFPHLRLDVPVSIGVGESLGRARDVLLGAARAHAGAIADPPPRVVVRALGDYRVDLELQVWIDDEADHIAQRFALRESAFEALRAAGVEMPFETLRVLGAGAADPASAAPPHAPSAGAGT